MVGERLRSWGTAAGAGLLYGVVWWVLGGLLIMPLWLGMPPLEIGETQLWSLVGHLTYGLVTGLVCGPCPRGQPAAPWQPPEAGRPRPEEVTRRPRV